MLRRIPPSLLFTAALLVVAAGLVTYGATRPLENRFHGRVADLLPPPPPGWTVTERAIADTPEMKQAVGEMLNFDDAMFVDYTSPAGNRLSVYIAYWRAGSMSSRLVAGHTPDICWVGGGWEKLTASQFAPPSPTGQPLQVAEARRFRFGSVTEHVWFWHLNGGTAVSYGTGREPPWHAPVTDLLHGGLDQRQEQFFIRLSSADPLETPVLAPALAPLLANLPVASPASQGD